MPYARPTLTQLRQQIAQDIAAQLIGSDPLLRHSNLNIMGIVQAGLASLHFGYLDYISRQAVPYTASDEFLEAWAGLKGVVRLTPTQASGTIKFPGVNGAVVANGTPIVRGDGVEYTSVGNATVIGGFATVNAIANADPEGKLGARGNCPVGTLMNLGQSVVNVSSAGTVSVAFTGGSDLETDESLRQRMLEVYAAQPEIGTVDDYENWAREVNGVTRAWALTDDRNAPVIDLYVMFDVTESVGGGFPVGNDGTATGESRGGAHATGDQLAVANHIYNVPLQPLLAIVIVRAPIANPINFTLNGISTVSAATKTAIANAIKDVFLRTSTPGAPVFLSEIESAIATVPGTEGFVITAPAGNVAQDRGELPTLGVVTYT